MILINDNPFEEIKSHAVETFPDECCGFLFGTERVDGTRIISRAMQVNNSKAGDKRRRFEITGRDYMQAERFASENDILFLGIYHSHPNHPAKASEHDRVAAQPYFSFVILSVMNGQVDHTRSWRLNNESQFEEETISSVHINQSI